LGDQPKTTSIVAAFDVKRVETRKRVEFTKAEPMQYEEVYGWYPQLLPQWPGGMGVHREVRLQCLKLQLVIPGIEYIKLRHYLSKKMKSMA